MEGHQKKRNTLKSRHSRCKKETNEIAYIFEVEYTVNYKKIVGIALLTDIAMKQMHAEKGPKLFLLTRAAFPNSEFIEERNQEIREKHRICPPQM